MSIGQDRIFAKHIRDYFSERLGVSFHERSFGFVGYKIIGTDLYIDEWYTEPNHPLIDTLRMIREVVAIGKAQGCTRLIGANETTLETYNDIRKFHTWFGMSYLCSNGTQELWSKVI